ncbi:MAG: SgcJ/EcaC family oxidoreductase [Acidobacteria bacterium]|nr:SgcJ/EcaC family oxidoreductase [Acidobacteriota bacterium]
MANAPNAAALTEAYTQAWNSGSPDAVANFYAENGRISINGGEPWVGRARVAQMAAGFFADVPDLTLRCDGVRAAGAHVVYLWTFVGHHARTGNRLEISGWEEWDFDPNEKVLHSRGWFDADDYARQVEGG